MENTAKMEYKDSERRSIELIVPKDVTKIKQEFDTAPALLCQRKKSIFRKASLNEGLIR